MGGAGGRLGLSAIGGRIEAALGAFGAAEPGAEADAEAMRAVAQAFADFFEAALPCASSEAYGALVHLCLVEVARARLARMAAAGESANVIGIESL
jgi:hypothetical protein